MTNGRIYNWSEFIQHIETRIKPILEAYTYRRELSELNEDNGGYLLIYSQDASEQIWVDVTPWSTFDAGQLKELCWLRVRIGSQYLKQLLGWGSETDMLLHSGWTYANAAELDQVTNEIADGLQTYLSKNG